MVIGDFDLIRVAVSPGKTGPPLVIDADAVLPLPVPLEPLQPVSGRHPEVVQVTGVVKHPQFATTYTLNRDRKPPGDRPVPDFLRLTIRESRNHRQTITLCVI